MKSAPRMVGLGRLELPTSRLSSARSNQLSYKPEPLMPRRSIDGRNHRCLGSSWKKEKRRRRLSRMSGLTGRLFKGAQKAPAEAIA